MRFCGIALRDNFREGLFEFINGHFVGFPIVGEDVELEFGLKAAEEVGVGASDGEFLGGGELVHRIILRFF